MDNQSYPSFVRILTLEPGLQIVTVTKLWEWPSERGGVLYGAGFEIRAVSQRRYEAVLSRISASPLGGCQASLSRVEDVVMIVEWRQLDSHLEIDRGKYPREYRQRRLPGT